MRTFGFSMVLLCLLMAADAPKDEATKKDQEKMQGNWTLESMTRDGDKLPDDEVQVLFRTVKGDQYSVARFDKVIGKGTFTIDASKKPKAIDFVPSNVDKAKAMLGIYELEGDRLTICYAPAGKERPTAMASTKDKPQTLAVWKREKK